MFLKYFSFISKEVYTRIFEAYVDIACKKDLLQVRNKCDFSGGLLVLLNC